MIKSPFLVIMGQLQDGNLRWPYAATRATYIVSAGISARTVPH